MFLITFLYINLQFRDRILSMWEGERRRSALKYFRHILMGHEISLKNFDGRQKNFLCASFLIFPVVYSENIQGSEHKAFKLAIKKIEKQGILKKQVKSTKVYGNW